MMKIITQKSLAKLSLLITAVLVHNGSAYAQSSPTNAQTSATTNVQKHIMQLAAPLLRTPEDRQRDSAKVINLTTPIIRPRPRRISPTTYQQLK